MRIAPIAVKSATAAASLALLATGFFVRKQVDTPTDLIAKESSLGNLVASRDNSRVESVSDTFYEVKKYLEDDYVEPIKDEQKLASGAVRGMVASLADPESLFMDKDEFRVFQSARVGRFEGVGVELALEIPTKLTNAGQSSIQPTGESSPEEALVLSPKIPKLTVATVVPGGPADRAGVKLGDVVYSVDGHWVINSDVIDEFNRAKKLFAAKKMTVTEINAIRKRLRAQTEHAMLPIKAKQLLTMGVDKPVAVIWDRSGKRIETSITKSVSTLPGFTVKNSTITLPFVAGSAERLKAALAGQTSVTIDLRNNTIGDFEEMKKCLAVVAPSGSYGIISNLKKEKPTGLTIQSGNPRPPKLTLVVDKSTRGAAEIFALALSKFAGAKLQGSDTGHERSVVELVGLPEGTGYCLVTGEYSVSKEGAK